MDGAPRKRRPQKATLLCKYITPPRRGRGRRAMHPALSSGPADVQAFQQGQVCRHGPWSAPHPRAPESTAGHLPAAPADWTHSPAVRPPRPQDTGLGNRARSRPGRQQDRCLVAVMPSPHRLDAHIDGQLQQQKHGQSLAERPQRGVEIRASLTGSAFCPRLRLSPRPRLPGGLLPQPALPASDGLRPHRVSGPSLV